MKLAGKYSQYAAPFSGGAEKGKIALSRLKQAGKLPSLSDTLGAAPMSYEASPRLVMQSAGGGNY